MPQRATSIHIAEPCAESWATMIPSGFGRHCAACAKTVVDFTQNTDVEILAYFRQNNRGGTCGRFRTAQVGRPLAAGVPTPATRRWQLWLAALVVSALAAQGCHTTMGEPAPINQTASQELTPDSAAVALVPYPTPIRGRVVDEYTQQPVGNVRVHLKGTSFFFVTDADGLFALSTAATPWRATHQNPYVLQLLANGYPPCERVLDYALPPPNQPLQIVPPDLPVPTELMGDVDVLR